MGDYHGHFHIIWEDHGNIYFRIKIYISNVIYVILYCICCRNSVHPLFLFPYIFNLSEKNSMEIKSNDLFILCIYFRIVIIQHFLGRVYIYIYSIMYMMNWEKHILHGDLVGWMFTYK